MASSWMPREARPTAGRGELGATLDPRERDADQLSEMRREPGGVSGGVTFAAVEASPRRSVVMSDVGQAGVVDRHHCGGCGGLDGDAVPDAGSGGIGVELGLDEDIADKPVVWLARSTAECWEIVALAGTGPLSGRRR